MINISTVDYILKRLEVFAVPMDEREFSREEYIKTFPRGIDYTSRGSKNRAKPVC
jgi:hypothetical protein